MMAAACGAAAPLTWAQTQTHIAGPTLVVPFAGTADPRTMWLGEAVAILLADDLNDAGVPALTRDERVRAFERLQVPIRASLTSGTVIRIGQLVGASTVVAGHVALDGEVLTVSVQSIRIDTGRIAAEFDERGTIDTLFDITARAARRLGPSTAPSPQTPALPHSTLLAYESFVKGLLAETPATQKTYLSKAVTLSPGFDQARLALALAYLDAGDFDQARTAALAVPETSALRRESQFAAALAEINLKRYDDAFGRLQALVSQLPSSEAYNNLGVIQLRRSTTEQAGRATYYFNKAVELDPSSADTTFNLGYAYWHDQDYPAAIYWLHEAVRRAPGDANAHFVLAAALDASAHGTEAQRERELARRLSAEYEEGEDRSAGGAVPKELERVCTYLQRPEAGKSDAALVATEQREQREMATFHLERGRRFYDHEDDRNALIELRRAIYLSPYEAQAHLLVGRIHLRAGRTREAIESLKIALWSADGAEGHVALGEAYVQAGDLAQAHNEAQRALALDPTRDDAKQLLARSDHAAPAQ